MSSGFPVNTSTTVHTNDRVRVPTDREVDAAVAMLRRLKPDEPLGPARARELRGLILGQQLRSRVLNGRYAGCKEMLAERDRALEIALSVNVEDEPPGDESDDEENE